MRLFKKWKFLKVILVLTFLSLGFSATTATSPLSPCDEAYFFDTLIWNCRACPPGYTQYRGNQTLCFCNGGLNKAITSGFMCDPKSLGSIAVGTYLEQTSNTGDGSLSSTGTMLTAAFQDGKWIKRQKYLGIELNSIASTQLGTGAGVTDSIKLLIPKLYASTITTYNYQIKDSTGALQYSQFLIHHLEHALFMFQEHTYPQKLANLCAIIKLDVSNTNNACSLYKTQFVPSSGISILKSTSDLTIFDSSCSDTSGAVCSSIHNLRIPTKQESTGYLSYINFKLMTFDLEGNLIDKKNINGNLPSLDNQLFLCPSTDVDGEKMKEFGTDFTLDCKISLAEFISDRSLTKFYELLVQTSSSTYAEVPVYNTENTISQYASRFVLIDNVSGFIVSSFSSSSATDYVAANTYLVPENLPTFISIASSIVMTIKIQSDNKIDMPTLAITYQTINVSEIQSGTTYAVSFKVKYTQNSSNFSNTAVPIFIVFAIFAGFLWMLKFNIWSKYNPQSRNLAPETFFFLWLVNGINNLINIWADFSFYILFFMTGYWFIIYKLQDSLYTLMINSDTDSGLNSVFIIFVVVQFLCKLITFFKFLYRQLQADVLFMDWENSKQYDEDSQEDEKKRGISIWRTLFVANEFNELSVTRQTSFEWTLFWVGLFLKGLKWDNLGQEVPYLSVDDDNYVKTNEILRYFIAVLIYIVVVLLQIIFKKLFVIWFPTPVQNFTDLCTVANISIFMMDDQLHGYYLHGKAPSGVAEGDTFWLKEAIEQESLTGNHRGLVKGENIQTFELYIPIDLRFEFNQEYLLKFDQMKANFNQNEWIMAKTVTKEMVNEMERQQYCQHITNVLKTYIKEVQIHSFNQILNKSFFHRLFGLPPTDPLQNGLPFFFRDPGMNYSSLFYYGNEWFLIMFEMITFLFWNMLTGSPLGSIMLTFLFNKVFEWMRDLFGRRNISTKTLIDQRFLI